MTFRNIMSWLMAPFSPSKDLEHGLAWLFPPKLPKVETWGSRIEYTEQGCIIPGSKRQHYANGIDRFWSEYDTRNRPTK